MILDKKIYVSPIVEIIEMEIGNIMVELSNTRGHSSEEIMTKENDRTGDWNNIWEGM